MQEPNNLNMEYIRNPAATGPESPKSPDENHGDPTVPVENVGCCPLYLVLSIVVLFVAGPIAVFLAGAGHGTYVPLRMVFPYAMIVLQAAGRGASIEVDVVCFALFLGQFPMYGLALDWARRRRWTARVGVCVGILHFIAIIVSQVIGEPRSH